MGTAASLLMIAAGAIMVWASTRPLRVSASTPSGSSSWRLVPRGLVLSIIFWSSWGGFGGRAGREGGTTVSERGPQRDPNPEQ